MCAAVRSHRFCCQCYSPTHLAVHSSHWAWVVLGVRDLEHSHTSNNAHTHTLLSFFCITYGRIMNGGECCGVLFVCARGRAAYVWVKYVLVLQSHVLPDSMVTNPSLLPIFPLYLVSSGRDYTGLDNLPEADMHSFIKKPKCSCSHASSSAKMHQLGPEQEHPWFTLECLWYIYWHLFQWCMTVWPRLLSCVLCDYVM